MRGTLEKGVPLSISINFPNSLILASEEAANT
jgi:hypothetical protein